MISEYLKKIQHGNFEIGKSDIHGNGVIAKLPIKAGDFINKAIEPTARSGSSDKTHDATMFGRHLNHCGDPNAETKYEEDLFNTYALKDIKPGDEITVDYRKNKKLEQPKDGWTK